MSRKKNKKEKYQPRPIINDFDETIFTEASEGLLDKLEETRLHEKDNLITTEVVLLVLFGLCIELHRNTEYILTNCTMIIRIVAGLCCVYFITYFLDKKRKHNIKSVPLYMYCLSILAFCLLLFPVITMILVNGLNELIITILIGWIILKPIVSIYSFIGTMQKTKTEIFRKFRNLNYNPETALFNNTELVKSEIFANFDTEPVDTVSQYIHPIEIDDTFDGTYKDVKFRIEEVNLQKIFKVAFWMNDKPFYFYPIYCAITIFRGVIISFDYNKMIKGKTIFRTKYDIFTRNNIIAPYTKMILGYLGIILLALYSQMNDSPFIKGISGVVLVVMLYSFICFMLSMIPSVIKDYKKYKKQDNADMKEVNLEGVDWDKKYEAYSTNQIDGRYLLTPAFMQRFLNLTTAFGTNKAKCTFFGNNITIAISTNKNLFEFGNLFTPIDGHDFYEELSSILELTEHFKLYEHTEL